jgi:F0F1-type ATP synthase assembly protein I
MYNRSTMKTPADATKYMQLLLKIGTVMVLSIGVTFGVGLYLIKRFSFPNWVLVVFTFLGVIGGFLNVVRVLKKLDHV